MLTFRIAITAAVMAFLTALTACLILIQIATFHAAAKEAASAAMDAASANTISRLEADVSELSSLIRVLSTSPSLADSDDRSEVDGAIALFKAALHELPQADSLYIGYSNGCWLQVRRLVVLICLRRGVFDHQVDLADLEPGHVQEFEVEFGELAQVFAEEALVPGRVEGELVVGEPEGPELFWAQVPNRNRGDFGYAQQLCRFDPGMSANDVLLGIDRNRNDEAERIEASGDLAQLLFAVLSLVFRIGF